jgi:hypothetical protein
MRVIFKAMLIVACGFAAVTTAHANDCVVKANQIVRDLGATIRRESTTMIFLEHSAVPGDFTLNCFVAKNSGFARTFSCAARCLPPTRC